MFRYDQIKTPLSFDIVLHIPIMSKSLSLLRTVCKATLDEMLEEIGKVDPRKTIDIGGYRLEANGQRVQRTMQLTKSETYLTDLMENICKQILID